MTLRFLDRVMPICSAYWVTFHPIPAAVTTTVFTKVITPWRLRTYRWVGKPDVVESGRPWRLWTTSAVQKWLDSPSLWQHPTLRKMRSTANHCMFFIPDTTFLRQVPWNLSCGRIITQHRYSLVTSSRVPGLGTSNPNRLFYTLPKPNKVSQSIWWKEPQ